MQMLQSAAVEYFRNNGMAGHMDRILGGQFPGYEHD
jgi:hypothetical protein